MPDKPLRVLHVIHWPRSGIVTLVRNLISSMPSDEIESHVIFFNHDEDTISDFKGLCKSANSLYLADSFVKGILKYHKIIRNVSPHILHTHSFQPYIWGEIFRSRKTMLINTIHNEYPFFRLRTAKSIVKKYLLFSFSKIFLAHVSAVSKGVSRELIRIGISPDYISLIENGIPLSKCNIRGYDKDKIKQELNLEVNHKLLVTVGRLNTQKGLGILLEAFRDICKINNNVKLVVVGDGAEKEKLFDLAKTFGINEKVIFLGFKNNPDQYLSIADLYICSSIYEGFPLSVAEAMAYGLPVIATRVGAIPEMIKNNVSGILVEPNNPTALANAINGLILGQYDLKSMGEEARKTIINKYGIERTAKLYIDLYKKINRKISQ